MRTWMVVLALAACGGDDAAVTPDAELAPDATTADAREDPCTSADGYTLYLNRAGGTFTMGTDDPAANVSAVLDMPRTLAAWPHGDSNWTALVACAREAMAPFNVQIVEVEPVGGSYTEIVFTDAYWDGGGGVLSIAPSVCPTGAPASQIAFVYGIATGDDAATSCNVAMFSVGIVAGLDVSLDPCDYLTYGTCPAGNVSWVDDDVPCGETTARNCRCDGQPTQNSHQTMLDRFGACP